MQQFLGPFHPVLVHLPIGILLLACLFQWLVLRDAYKKLEPAIGIALFWGMIFAILSCITGYLLSQTGDYEGDLVNNHQWLGISVAIVSIVQYYLYKRSVNAGFARWLALILFLLIIITGHLGGSLTHGSGYLAEGLHSGDKGGAALKPIPNIQEAGLYADVVQPLFQNRCYNCHGPNKQKGKLRLDKPELIMKGGKDGKVIEAGKADKSEMIERLLLPPEDEDHMPPKEKPQLTRGEVALLHWWISTGADFNKKVKDLPQTNEIRPILLALQSGAIGEESKPTDVPAVDVGKADADAVDRLKKAGVMVMPVARNSNYLSVSFFTAGAGADSLIKLLEPLKKQLVWLKLDNAAVNDAAMDEISRLTTLTRLHLSNTNITDAGLVKLQTLQELQSLNLVGTKITAQGLAKLSGLKKLKNLYLYKTAVGNNDWSVLKKTFPATQVDSGKYAVPTLVTDTTVVKY